MFPLRGAADLIFSRHLFGARTIESILSLPDPIIQTAKMPACAESRFDGVFPFLQSGCMKALVIPALLVGRLHRGGELGIDRDL